MSDAGRQCSPGGENAISERSEGFRNAGGCEFRHLDARSCLPPAGSFRLLASSRKRRGTVLRSRAISAASRNLSE